MRFVRDILSVLAVILALPWGAVMGHSASVAAEVAPAIASSEAAETEAVAVPGKRCRTALPTGSSCGFDVVSPADGALSSECGATKTGRARSARLPGGLSRPPPHGPPRPV